MSNISYLRLKEKVAKLEKDINTLIFHPESHEANLIRSRKEFKNTANNAVLYGSRQTSKETIEAFTQ